MREIRDRPSLVARRDAEQVGDAADLTQPGTSVSRSTITEARAVGRGPDLQNALSLVCSSSGAPEFHWQEVRRPLQAAAKDGVARDRMLVLVIARFARAFAPIVGIVDHYCSFVES
jgi:hypothetical protein